MSELLAETRVQQLLRSPGGCTLLITAADAGMTPREIVEPVTALHLVATAVGEIIPWWPNHDQTLSRALREGTRHRDLAGALVREPGIERWWAPLDRDDQIWMESEASPDFPDPDTFPTPTEPPDRGDIYAQQPHPQFVTSTGEDRWTSMLASAVDWDVNNWPPAQRKHVQVVPDAKVYEIVTAEDWHALAVAHGVRSDPEHSVHAGNWPGQPWGANDGLVPDWQEIARAWDGVHITLWALLTATQVRVTSGAGWSEAWAWEFEQTIWLHWAFENVEELSPVVSPVPQPAYFPSPIRYGDVETWQDVRREIELPPLPTG